MAQTGETVIVLTAGLPNVGQTGETVIFITAGIPNAFTVGPEPPEPPAVVESLVETKIGIQCSIGIS